MPAKLTIDEVYDKIEELVHENGLSMVLLLEYDKDHVPEGLKDSDTEMVGHICHNISLAAMAKTIDHLQQEIVTRALIQSLLPVNHKPSHN
jgi:hypothetical protein